MGKWSEEEKQYLIDNYGKITAKEIAKKLNRKRSQVAEKAMNLKLKSNLGILPAKNWEERLSRTQIKMITPYKGVSSKSSFECPFCKKIFETKLCRILSRHTYSCGCVNVGRRRGTEHISSSLFNAIKNMAISRNIIFDITFNYLEELLIKQDFKCALSGQILICGYKKELKNLTLSLDRIDSKVGYIEGNVQWVHKDINLAKQSLSQEYFIDMCTKVANHARNKFNNTNK